MLNFHGLASTCKYLVWEARPNQLQCRSLSVSRMGKEGSGDAQSCSVNIVASMQLY